MEMSPCSSLTFRKKEVLSGTTQQQCAVPFSDSKSGVKDFCFWQTGCVCSPSELCLLFHFIWGIIKKGGKIAPVCHYFTRQLCATGRLTNNQTMGQSIVQRHISDLRFSREPLFDTSPEPLGRWEHGECQLNPPDAAEEFAALTTSSTQLDFCQS